MRIKNILAIVLSSLLAAGTAQARDFRAADVHPLDYPTTMAVKRIGEIISKKTNGKYNIRMYGNSALGPEKGTVEQTRIGAIDILRINTANFHDIVPESMVPSFPFIFRDIAHFRKTMNGPIGDEILAAFDNMGATPTVIPYADLYSALKNNVVDAAENNYSSYETSRHYEAAPIYSETGHVMAPEILVFSKKVWDTLTKEEQQIIRSAAKEATPYYIELWTKKEQASKEAAKKAGATFIEDVNKSEFSNAMKPVWDKFAPTPELKALVQKIVNTK